MVNKVIIENKIEAIHQCLNKIKYDSASIGLMGGLSGQILFEYHSHEKTNKNEDELISSLESLYSFIPDANTGLTYSI